MAIAYRLTPELRIKLKNSLGILVRGSFTETMRRFKDLVDKEKPPCIISVGDTVLRNLAKNHIIPQLSIIDNICMRRNVGEPSPPIGEQTVHVRNPQATITREAINAIQDALKSDMQTKIVVEGEEDLLTLIAILHAPKDSFVVYGQPYEGIVVVKATTEKKKEIAQILKEMDIS